MDKKAQRQIIEEFGNNVRKVRTVRGLTQFQLGVEIGSDYRLIQRIENAECATSIVNAYLLAKVLGVGVGDLFEGLDQL
jgi:transcriptional regulator with XRE-family HTH domain